MILSKRMRRCALLLGSAMGLALMYEPASAQTAFTGIGGVVSGPNLSNVTDVSANGAVVVGAIATGSGKEAVTWSMGGGLTRLGDLPGGPSDSMAFGVSANGNVVVGYGWSDSARQAVVWQSGVITAIPFSPGGFESIALDVSADGSFVVGFEQLASHDEAFLWTAGGGVQHLGGLSSNIRSYAYAISADGSVIVGESQNDAGHLEAFRWTGGSMMGLGSYLDYRGSTASDVSDDGSVIVGALIPFGSSLSDRQAFRWTAGGITALGFLASNHNNSYATGVSGDGAVVVGVSQMYGNANFSDAFIWNGNDGMRAVADVLTANGVNLGAWRLHIANGVSADGSVIVGDGLNPNGQNEGWWARITPTSTLPPDPFIGVGGADAAPNGSFIVDVSADGVRAVGSVQTAAGNEAAYWTFTGGLVAIGDLPGGALESTAHATDADGSVIVGGGTTDFTRQAFRWEGGAMTALPLTTGAISSEAYGVNADGSVVVGYQIFPAGAQAFRWTSGGGMENLGGLTPANLSFARAVNADGSVVVGDSINATNANEAYRWTRGGGMVGLGYISGDIGSVATDVSDDGSVIVGSSYKPNNNVQEAFRWTEGDGMAGLGYLQGDNHSVAHAVSADGSVVVGSSVLQGTPGGTQRAFVWTEQDRMRAIADVLTSAGVNLGTWELRNATGVSANGSVIVGQGVNPNGRPEGWWARIGATGGPGDPPPNDPGSGDPPPQQPGFISGHVLGHTVTQGSGAATSGAGSASSNSGVVSSESSSSTAAGSFQRSYAANFAGRQIVSDASPGIGVASGQRAGELRAFMLGGWGSFQGDISEAESVDATWGVRYQLTPTLRLGGAFRYVSGEGELGLYGGDIELDSRALQAFASYESDTNGLRVYLVGLAGAVDATIERGYLNGVLPDASSGDRDGETLSATVLAGWTMPVGDGAIMPFVRYDVSSIELDGYTETGGVFPARFDAISETMRESRLGVRGRVPLSDQLEVEGAFAWGHRFDDRLSVVTGEVIGLTPFAYEGRRLESDWTEASANLSWRPNEDMRIRFGVEGSTEGDTMPDLGMRIGVDVRL